MFNNIRYSGELYRKSNHRAGYDIINHKNVIIPAGQTVKIKTNVRFPNGIGDNFALVTLRSSYQQSGLLMPSIGVVDENYTEKIFITVKNVTDKQIIIKKGDRFFQLVFIKKNDIQLEQIQKKVFNND